MNCTSRLLIWQSIVVIAGMHPMPRQVSNTYLPAMVLPKTGQNGLVLGGTGQFRLVRTSMDQFGSHTKPNLNTVDTILVWYGTGQYGRP